MEWTLGVGVRPCRRFQQRWQRGQPVVVHDIRIGPGWSPGELQPLIVRAHKEMAKDLRRATQRLDHLQVHHGGCWGLELQQAGICRNGKL